MSWIILRLLIPIACLLPASVMTYAQNGRPVIFTTPSKIAIAKFKFGERDNIEIRLRAALTLTAANDDDTIAGTLVLTIPDDERKKLAQLSGKELSTIPASYFKKDIIAAFRKGTACPVAHIVVPATELDSSGTQVQLGRIVLEINENQGQMTQLLCSWARQINANRHRRGIIAAINRLLTAESDTETLTRP